MTVEFALNGGPMFKFTEAISLVVECQDQRECAALQRAYARS